MQQSVSWLSASGQIEEIVGAALLAYAFVFTKRGDLSSAAPTGDPLAWLPRFYAQRASQAGETAFGLVTLAGGFVLQLLGTLNVSATWWAATLAALVCLPLAYGVRAVLPPRMMGRWLRHMRYQTPEDAAMVLAVYSGKPVRRGGSQVPLPGEEPTAWIDRSWGRGTTAAMVRSPAP